MLLDVPAIAKALTTPAFTPTNPVEPDIDWKFAKNAPSEIKGSPATPLAFVIPKPVPTPIERAVSVPRAVLTCIPLLELFKLAAAPVKLICNVP